LHRLQAGVQISQGAEAKVWAAKFLQRDAIIKQRFSKKYRHPTLDAALTMQRLKAEVRCMVRARKLGVCTPVPYYTEVAAASIYMERIQGRSVKQVGLLDRAACDLDKWRVLCIILQLRSS
jgi:TP53 regulating kinase and related kinases